MDTIALEQGQVQYRAAGPENSPHPPVVFVHGLLVNGELWTQVADLLAERGIRSYAPTLPLGSHATPLRPDTPLGPREVARLVNDFMAKLGLTDVTLVGSDTGGALCQFLIDDDPSRVGRLALTNCDAFEKFPPAPFGLIVALGKRRGGMRLMSAAIGPRPLRSSYAGYGGLAHKPDAALTKNWVTPSRESAGTREDTARFLRQVRPADLLDVSTRLRTFTKPVLLVWGTDDRFFKLSLGRRLADAFDNATLVEVPGSRTFVSLDAPERLAAELADRFYSGPDEQGQIELA